MLPFMLLVLVMTTELPAPLAMLTLGPSPTMGCTSRLLCGAPVPKKLLTWLMLVLLMNCLGVPGGPQDCTLDPDCG